MEQNHISILSKYPNNIINIGNNDCLYFDNIINKNFYDIYNEVNWDNILNKEKKISRLVSVQSSNYTVQGKEIIPLYRHPTCVYIRPDNWTPIVKKIKDQIDLFFNLNPEYLNHALIQEYNKDSYIKSHSDKTLDINDESVIITASFGATRILDFTDKKKINKKQSVILDDGSLFILGSSTNRLFNHGIIDKKKKKDCELINNGKRISITFRSIGTFINDLNEITGKGCLKVQRSEIDQKNELKDAFYRENTTIEKEEYTNGFSIINVF